MVNIAEVKEVMDECSMPFQMPLVDFVSRALEINEDVFGALLHKRTKKDILTYLKSSSVTIEDLDFLLVRIVASLNKYCGIINIIKSKENICKNILFRLIYTIFHLKFMRIII